MSALQLKNPILEFLYFNSYLEINGIKIPIIQKKECGIAIKLPGETSPALVQEWRIAGEVKDEKFTW